MLCAPRVQELAASVEERQKLWQQMQQTAALAAQPLPSQAKVLCASRVQELAASVEERQRLWRQMCEQLL